MKLRETDFFKKIISDEQIVDNFYKDFGLPQNFLDEYLETEFLIWLRNQLGEKYMTVSKKDVEHMLKDIKSLRLSNQKLIEKVISLQVEVRVANMQTLRIAKALKIPTKKYRSSGPKIPELQALPYGI